MDELNTCLQEIDINPDDSSFYAKAFSAMVKVQKKLFAKGGDNFKRVLSEEYDDLSKRVERSKFQESASVRNVLKTRRLANLLIMDDGEFNLSLIPKVIKHLSSHLYSLGPDRQHDAVRNEHLLRVLHILLENKNIIRQIKMITKPFSHKVADQIIRDTLQLSPHAAVTDAHARRASLSAWMCYLRQNVGSCFATAPAIIVHDEQPEQFFKDISLLLGTGRLKRTFGGVEYSVPISLSWGAGDLRKGVVILPENQRDREGLGLSPGILAALEASNLIDSTLPLKEKIELSRKQVLEALKIIEKPEAPFLVVTAEDILRILLLKHFQITEKDLEEFEKRPKGMIHSGLMMLVPTAPHMGGKGEACTAFYAQFEIAGNAFKAIADNALLKTWEFSLASFAETKPSFTTWNLYSSLGLKPEEVGGIGRCLYEEIKGKLDAANAKMHEYQQEYEMAYTHLKYLEARVRGASSDKEMQWIKIEYESKRNEFRTFEEMRNRIHFKAERFANLLNDIVDAYYELFPKYFQEVYDADMHEVTTGFYDDSPAGFRLLYKHGRANTAQWTLIHSPQEYIETLANFFVSTESEITGLPTFEGLQEDISEIVTKVVTHIKTPEFLETAFHRMALAHNTKPIKDPLEHLDKIDKKPWSYTSGGSMSNLISSYFCLDRKPEEASRWVESPMELLVFFVDALKQMPPKLTEEYLKDPKKSILMHSPTHAFNLKPGIELFREAWQNDAFTYTWVRDHFVLPMERVPEYMFLDEEMMTFLMEHLLNFVPRNYKHRFNTVFAQLHGKKNPREFRSFLVEGMEHDRGLNRNGQVILDPDIIDSTLYSMLPLFHSSELKTRLEKILFKLPGINEQDKKNLDGCIEAVLDRWKKVQLVTAKQLQDLAKAILVLYKKETSSPYDYHWLVAQRAQKELYALPSPIVFADTNWVKDYFSFVVNPGTGKLDLWRTDYTGSQGSPMSMWQPWLDGSRKDITWGIYTRPYEYKA